ncbi:hypothetical protein NQ314_020371 [Rhamnusium bicolor]|uniref:Uncharacterized protein n=1 Tax=Rhamnusium bicolor TaxID=1586634 RepID=A0AAV8WK16_9CUCU|nr:hypothetical protein NQ314_020371 [Rhamnusium bicolor]
MDNNCLPAERNLTHVKWLQMPRWHFRMLNDIRRNTAYDKAITDTISKGYNSVVDVGSGCGLLSLFASRDPNTKVDAIEENKTLAKMSVKVYEENDVKNVSVVNVNSSELAGPLDKCNLVITEIFDVAFFGERALETIIHAVTVLRTERDYKIIPCGAKLYVTGIFSPQIHSKTWLKPNSQQILQLYNICVKKIRSEPYEGVDLTEVGLEYLTNTAEFFRMYFYDIGRIEEMLDGYQEVIHLRCKAGIIQAVAVWFDLNLTEEISITTNPFDENRVRCWEQAIFPLDHPMIFQYSMSRVEFFEVWRRNTKTSRNSEIYAYVLNKFNLNHVPPTTERQFKNKIKLMSLTIAAKWNSSGKREERFRAKYEKWLHGENIVFQLDEGDEYSLEEPTTSSTSGRPIKQFQDSSEKTKKRRIKDIVEAKSVQELALAAEVALRKSGKRDAASLIKEIVDYCVFPLFGFLMAKNNNTIYHPVTKDDDIEFFYHMLTVYQIPADQFILLEQRLAETPDISADQPSIYFFEPLNIDGSIENILHEKREEMETSETIVIPQSVKVNVQLIHSAYIDHCNKVNDENVLGFKIAKFMNEYTVRIENN